MIVKNLIVFFFFGLGVSGCAGTDPKLELFPEEIEGNPLALIIGEPKKFEEIGFQEVEEGYLPWYVWYGVTFTSYDVIFGEVPEGNLKIPLLFHALPRKGLEIFVLLEAQEGQELKGLYWGFPRENVCIDGAAFAHLEKKYPEGKAKKKLSEFLEGEFNSCYWTGRLIE